MRSILWALCLACLVTEARASDLVVYGAGSLREAIGQIATEFGQAHGITVAMQFGPSGRMRERIERGERVDLFTSADVGHARKLVEDGRASVMAVFVRNTVCVLSPAKFGATTETVLDKLLAPGVRVGVSPPKADPLGDYTVRLFEMVERMRPGSGGALQARAVVLDNPPGSPPPKSGDTDADAILDGRVDASIVYCSGRDRYARLLPDARLVQLPPWPAGRPGVWACSAEGCASGCGFAGADDPLPGRPKDHGRPRAQSRDVARRSVMPVGSAAP